MKRKSSNDIMQSHGRTLIQIVNIAWRAGEWQTQEPDNNVAAIFFSIVVIYPKRMTVTHKAKRENHGNVATSTQSSQIYWENPTFDVIAIELFKLNQILRMGARIWQKRKKREERNRKRENRLTSLFHKIDNTIANTLCMLNTYVDA